jgi:hypothetical protein
MMKCATKICLAILLLALTSCESIDSEVSVGSCEETLVSTHTDSCHAHFSSNYGFVYNKQRMPPMIKGFNRDKCGRQDHFAKWAVGDLVVTVLTGAVFRATLDDAFSGPAPSPCSPQ